MPLTVQVPTVGQANSTEAVKVTNTLTNLSTWANGNIAAGDLAAALAQSAAVNQSGQTVKGAVNIAASESRSNTAYGTLTTPDQVTGITLASNGLIAVWYQATWQESVIGASRAAIFLGANQVVRAATASSPLVVETTARSNTANTNNALSTAATGIVTIDTGVAYTGDLTTGQILGTAASGCGPCYIFAAAGSYTIAIMFKASSGSVTASNRKLWVQALSFA